MIRKRFILIICLIALCGCSSATPKAINHHVSDILLKIPLSSVVAPTTHTKEVYRYYLPNDMGIITSNQLSSVLQKDGFKIVMNFNVASIIISEYYTNLDDEQFQSNVTVKQYTEEKLKKLMENGLLVSKNEVENEIEDIEDNEKLDLNLYVSEENGVTIYKGIFYNRNKNPYAFQLKMKHVNNDYYIHLDGTVASLTTIVPGVEVDNVVNSMIHILKSIDYDKEMILKNYSLKYDLKVMQKKFQKNQDYIYRNLNKDGYLEDLINDENLDLLE